MQPVEDIFAQSPKIPRFSNQISEDLEILEPLLLELFAGGHRVTQEITKHVLTSGGKRVRPALFFLICDLLGYHGEFKHKIAAVTEYVHTASLLHDDVIDNSPLRRNRPTAQTLWGDRSAILVGDVVYARASAIMAETGEIEIVRSFALAIQAMSEAELLQMDHSFNLSMREEDYYSIVRGKTGVLLATACKVAAILAKKPQMLWNDLFQFGMAIGTAFQLIDDALDFTGSQKFFGKNTLSDLPEGKVTLPVILALNSLTEQEQKDILPLYSSQNFSSENVTFLSQLVEKYKTVDQVRQIAKAHTQEALDIIFRIFPKNTKRDNLLELVEIMLNRSC